MNNLEHQRRLKRLENLVASGGGGGGGIETPLSRYKFIDGGALESTRNGSPSAAAFKSVTEWLASLGTSTTAADSQAQQAGYLTPCLAGYTEDVTFPAYRCTSLVADTLGLPVSTGGVVIQGNAVWNNLAGTNHAPTAEAILEINVPFSGSLTVTDDAVGSLIVCESDSLGAGAPFFASVDAHTTTLLASVTFIGVSVPGAVNLGVNAGIILANGAGITGLLTCKFVSANASVLGSFTLPAGNTQSGLVSVSFSATPTYTGGAGTSCQMDGATARSFAAVGGLQSPAANDAGPAIVVTGGYNGGAVEGHALTNADVTVTVRGDGASAGFQGSNSGNHYTLPTATLTGDHVLTLGTNGAKAGDTILVTRIDASAHLYTVKDDAGTTLFVMAVSKENFALCTYNGTHFVLTQMGVN